MNNLSEEEKRELLVELNEALYIRIRKVQELTNYNPFNSFLERTKDRHDKIRSLIESAGRPTVTDKEKRELLAEFDKLTIGDSNPNTIDNFQRFGKLRLMFLSLIESAGRPRVTREWIRKYAYTISGLSIDPMSVNYAKKISAIEAETIISKMLQEAGVEVGDSEKEK